MKIKLTKPYFVGNELKYLTELLSGDATISGDGEFTKKVQNYFERKYGVKKALLTTSATSALEFAVQLLDLAPGDQVIIPSFTFPSTANSVLLKSGPKVIFADIDPSTMNVDPDDIVKKITKKTKAIFVVHYAGVSADMDKILKIANKYNLKIVEDAAQGIGAKWRDKYLGTIGHFGVISFHDTKNVVSGEGGILFINANDKKTIEKAEIIRQKGTNRDKFLRGEVDKYSWVDVGSSYLPSEVTAALVLAQLEKIHEITKKRMAIYNFYSVSLAPYVKRGLIKVGEVPQYAVHNAHIFFITFENQKKRNFVMEYLKRKGVGATFHYIPLHSSPQGRKLGFKKEDCPVAEKVANSLLRLPLYPQMTKSEMKYVVASVSQAIEKLDKLTRKTQKKRVLNKDFEFNRVAS